MASSGDLISPKQVARAIGVSESSLKRWCDQGLIKTVRTAGGHRKMRMADVMRFTREHDHVLVSPNLLGLPPASPHAVLGLRRSRSLLADALLAGDELLARRVVFDLYLAKHSLSVIFDEVIAGAFRDIGDLWACHSIDVYQERRGCEITRQILFDLRKVQQLPDSAWPAIGGTMDGDLYALPPAMAELVLRESGFNAVSLGASIPFSSLIKAVQAMRPKLFWLSVSYIREGLDFLTEFAALSQACVASNTAIVVGGRALNEGLRQRMTYTAFCDTMQHLEGIAKALGSTSKQTARQSAGKYRGGKRAETATRPKPTTAKRGSS
jgi:excisionase family DNA binding protein